MSYHVGRNQQQLGQFTEEQIRDGLERGTFLTSDFTWRDGMPEWKRLDQVFGFAAARSLSSPLTSQGPAAPPIPTFTQPGTSGIGVMPTPGIAVASLVLGIVALVGLFSCFVGAILGIPGAICGHKALALIKRSEGQFQGRGVALGGLVTSYIAIALGALMLVVFVVVFVVAAASGAR